MSNVDSNLYSSEDSEILGLLGQEYLWFYNHIEWVLFCLIVFFHGFLYMLKFDNPGMHYYY